jgi:hypothetical protein
MAQAASLSATDPAAEHMIALKLAEKQRRKIKRDAMKAGAATAPEAAKRLEAEQLAENKSRNVKLAAMRPDLRLAQQHLGTKRPADNQSRSAKQTAKRAAMRAAAATDLGIAKRLATARLAANQYYTAKRAAMRAAAATDPDVAKRLKAERLAASQGRQARRAAKRPQTQTQLLVTAPAGPSTHLSQQAVFTPQLEAVQPTLAVISAAGRTDADHECASYTRSFFHFLM